MARPTNCFGGTCSTSYELFWWDVQHVLRIVLVGRVAHPVKTARMSYENSLHVLPKWPAHLTEKEAAMCLCCHSHVLLLLPLFGRTCELFS